MEKKMTDQFVTTFVSDLKDLAELRKNESVLKEQIAGLQEKLNATPEAKAVETALAERKALQEKVALLEDFIRKSALEQFVETKVKPTVAGITVKIFKILKYEKKAAESWAKEKMPELFKFDERGFEKYAKAVADTIPVPCVTFEDDPRVEIASDLSEYLV
jgi:hypothetical protein